MTTPAERYALVHFGKEGLLLDLATGNLFQLNESAALVWAGSLEGAPMNAVAEALARRYELPLATAREDVARALALTPETAARGEPDGPYLYERAPGGYLLSRDGLPLLNVDEQGGVIHAADPEPAARRDWPTVLQAIAPKLMALRGHFVLHASSVLLNQSVIGFAGKSGAGKTTTARMLARDGAKLLGEDKLVLRATESGVDAVIGCERHIFAWAAAAASNLSAGRPASCDGLDAAVVGETRPIAEIGFLDRARRSGGSLAAIALDRAEATRGLFATSFHGSDRPEAWRRHLQAAASAAARLTAFEVTTPDGLPALESAAREVTARGTLAQIAMTAS